MMCLSKFTKKLSTCFKEECVSTFESFKANPGGSLAVVAIIFFCFARTGYCDVDQTLRNILSTFTQKIIPTAAIFGLIWAGLSCAAGNPAGRSRLILVIFGAVICFGATSIVNFIRGIVS
jgi:type IV secretory pathway VirB2 component (pilin)